jgi:hypothetical protein
VGKCLADSRELFVFLKPALQKSALVCEYRQLESVLSILGQNMMILREHIDK